MNKGWLFVIMLAGCAEPTEPTPVRETIAGYFTVPGRADLAVYLYDDVDGPQPEQFFVDEYGRGSSGDLRGVWWGTYSEASPDLLFAVREEVGAPHLTGARWINRPVSFTASLDRGIGAVEFRRTADAPPGGL